MQHPAELMDCNTQTCMPYMLLELEIREATTIDAEGISILICELSTKFITPELTAEGTDTLLASMSPVAISKYIETGYQYHVAKIDSRLVGVSAVKDNSHLYHLFVAERYHHQGIARRLWENSLATCLSKGNPGEFTVNSSRHALDVYQKLGFVVQTGQEEKDGVIYFPMKMTISQPALLSP